MLRFVFKILVPALLVFREQQAHLLVNRNNSNTPPFLSSIIVSTSIIITTESLWWQCRLPNYTCVCLLLYVSICLSLCLFSVCPCVPWLHAGLFACLLYLLPECLPDIACRRACLLTSRTTRLIQLSISSTCKWLLTRTKNSLSLLHGLVISHGCGARLLRVCEYSLRSL
jgi:hypothetical protein